MNDNLTEHIDNALKNKLIEIIEKGYYVNPKIQQSDRVKYISYYKLSNLQDVYSLLSSLDKDVIIANIVSTDEIKEIIKKQL